MELEMHAQWTGKDSGNFGTQLALEKGLNGVPQNTWMWLEDNSGCIQNVLKDVSEELIVSRGVQEQKPHLYQDFTIIRLSVDLKGFQIRGWMDPEHVWMFLPHNQEESTCEGTKYLCVVLA